MMTTPNSGVAFAVMADGSQRSEWSDERINDRAKTIDNELFALHEIPVEVAKMSVKMDELRQRMDGCFDLTHQTADALDRYIDHERMRRERERDERDKRHEEERKERDRRYAEEKEDREQRRRDAHRFFITTGIATIGVLVAAATRFFS